MSKNEKDPYLGSTLAISLGRTKREAEEKMMEMAADNVEKLTDKLGEEVYCVVEDPATGKEAGGVWPRRQRGKFFPGLSAEQHERIFGKKETA